MRIQHNIMAMNSYRNLSGNNNALSKNLEKLSSGYRINRAGDDAAGLAISEKMRAQIAGLDQAQKNAQSGINLVKTAEGALTEVHDMLNRMVTLASQSANGTYTATDREKLQAEVDALTSEIDRIADNSNFNGAKLLDGSLAAEAKAAVNDNEAINLKTVKGAATLTTVPATKAQTTFKFTDVVQASTHAANSTDGIVEVALGLSDGTTITVNVAIANGDTTAQVATAFETALKNDENVKELFDVSATGTNAVGDLLALSFTAKNTGSGSLTVDTLTFTEKKISDQAGGFANATTGGVITYGAGSAFGTIPTTAQNTILNDSGKDAYAQINFGADTVTNADLLGKKTEIGDKTYVFVDGQSVHNLEEGEIGVYMGDSRNETMKNLVASLKANGVESAEIDGINIKIGDTTELEVANEVTNSVKSESAAIEIEYKEAQNAVFQFATATGTAVAGTQTATLFFTDAEGVEKSVKVSYTEDDASNDYSQIVAAINGNDTLKELFTASVSGSNLVIEAKGDVKGATVTRLETSDASTAGALTNPTEAHAAGLTVDLDTNTLNPGETITINGKTYEFATAESMKNGAESENTLVAIGADKASTAANLMSALKNDGVDSKVMTDGKLLIENTEEPAQTEVAGGLQLQIGADSVETIKVTVESMKAEDLGIKGLNIGDVESANKAIETIKAAIEQVSVTRGNLGAIQNRLEHTINNLGVMEENITDAESNIRDTDIADEMMAYTKNNILIQSAQAMLAQANQVPQGVLQLMG